MKNPTFGNDTHTLFKHIWKMYKTDQTRMQQILKPHTNPHI